MPHEEPFYCEARDPWTEAWEKADAMKLCARTVTHHYTKPLDDTDEVRLSTVCARECPAYRYLTFTGSKMLRLLKTIQEWEGGPIELEDESLRLVKSLLIRAIEDDLFGMGN